MDDESLLGVLHEAADAVRRALDGLDDWGPSGGPAGQYRSDVVADRAATAVLDRAGLGWLSEETGVAHADRPVVVVVDPVDGSTNAACGLPWYATSLCALDADGPRAAVVVNQASGRRYDAVRDGGARVDGAPIAPRATTAIGTAVVGVSGWPARPLGWWQFRALGAAALDLCAVAAGTLDAYVDCGLDAHGPWDYLGGLLVCREAGAVVVDAWQRELVAVDAGVRRTPVAAATPELLAAALTARRDVPPRPPA